MRPVYTLLSIAAGVAASFIVSPALAGERLTVYTYYSFTAEWGPGPKVKEAFEKECGCQLDLVPVADGVALLNRLRLEGARTKADIVLGLDTNLTTEAKATGLFAPHGIDPAAISVPGGYDDEIFVPYDYAHFSIIYDSDKIKRPPASMKELIDGNPTEKIIIQDPRTSTPGLGLLLWIKAIYGDDAPKAWEKLEKRVLTVTPGWSEGYGLFTKGEAPYVLSYETSPAYHIIADKEHRYRGTAFEEGNYLQIEVAGITVKGKENPLSGKFLSFMTSPVFQDIIPETNWMYPAGKTSAPLDPGFQELVKPTKTLILASDEVAKNRKAWIDEWLSVMSR